MSGTSRNGATFARRLAWRATTCSSRSCAAWRPRIGSIRRPSDGWRIVCAITASRRVRVDEMAERLRLLGDLTVSESERTDGGVPGRA